MGCVFSASTDGLGKRDCRLSFIQQAFIPSTCGEGNTLPALKWLNIYKEMSRAYQSHSVNIYRAPSLLKVQG